MKKQRMPLTWVVIAVCALNYGVSLLLQHSGISRINAEILAGGTTDGAADNAGGGALGSICGDPFRFFQGLAFFLVCGFLCGGFFLGLLSFQLFFLRQLFFVFVVLGVDIHIFCSDIFI